MIFEAFLCLPLVAVSVSTDEVSCSRFEYEYKVIEQLVNLTNRLVEMEKSNAEKDRTIQNLTEEVKRTKTMRGWPGGSVYIRWGSSECPGGNGTELIYKGYAAGSHYSHTGGASNYICLPEDPTWGKYGDVRSTVSAYVLGAEYEFGMQGDPSLTNLFPGVQDNDVPCAVCRSRRSAMVMIPGRKDCYDSWTLEYSGYLAADYQEHALTSEYVCLDENLEHLDGGQADENGALFYLVEAICGSLKCPPYVNGRELSCVVCTK